MPVVAGIGYGWAQAVRFARIAEEAGADALLVLPHYLVAAPQEGLVEQLEADRRPHPAAAHRLPARPGRLHRRVAPAASPASPNVIGLKDGHSDLDRLQRLTLAAPEGFLFFNGAATAEIQARAYATVGVPAYSSAVHAFAPEIAERLLRRAAATATTRRVERLLRGFYVPLVELRDRVPGYAVSLVKAAARLRGRPVGPVRAPLTDPRPADLADLKTLLATGTRPRPGADVTMSTRPTSPITEVRLTPILVADPPLLNTQGVHQPYTPRLIVEVVTADGVTGVGETYGDTKYLELAAAARPRSCPAARSAI